MNAQGYEILSLAARYWFVALGALILALSARTVYLSVRRDLSHTGEERPLLTLVLISDADRRLKRGYARAVYNEGMVGAGRVCDTRIRHRGLKKRHAAFREADDGVMVLPAGGALVAVDGEAAGGSAYARFGGRVQMGPLIFTIVEGGDPDEA